MNDVNTYEFTVIKNIDIDLNFQQIYNLLKEENINEDDMPNCFGDNICYYLKELGIETPDDEDSASDVYDLIANDFYDWMKEKFSWFR